jgi:hypothetical protein
LKKAQRESPKGLLPLSFSFETTIVSEVFDGNKIKYSFS